MKTNLQNLFDSFLRILAAVIVLVGSFDLFLKLIEVLQTKTGFEFSYWGSIGPTYEMLIYIGILLGITWSVYAQRKKQLSNVLRNFCQIFIRMWLAFLISSYGFAKIMKTQFQIPEHIKDIPMSAQHPFNLTWYYFGFSREYALILSGVEIGGSLLLLFRKTRLLGAAILFPAMLNILFINKYYHINPWSFFASVFFTLGTAYLLLIDYEKLLNCFFDFGNIPKIKTSSLWKAFLKALVMVASFGLIWMYAHDSPSNNTYLKGVWSIESLQKDGEEPIFPNQTELVLTKLYFEYASPGQTVLEFNHFSNRENAKYKLNKDMDSLTIYSRFGPFVLGISQIDSKTLRLIGLHGSDSIKLNLIKIRETSR